MARVRSRDNGEFVCRREIVWHGTRRTAEFVFENVRDRADLPDAQFEPVVTGNVRFVFDYPFDDRLDPSDEVRRVFGLSRAGMEAPTLVWLPLFSRSSDPHSSAGC